MSTEASVTSYPHQRFVPPKMAELVGAAEWNPLTATGCLLIGHACCGAVVRAERNKSVPYTTLLPVAVKCALLSRTAQNPGELCSKNASMWASFAKESGA